MQHTKALFLGALFVGIGTVTAINEIGIGLYPSAAPAGVSSVVLAHPSSGRQPQAVHAGPFEVGIVR